MIAASRACSTSIRPTHPTITNQTSRHDAEALGAEDVQDTVVEAGGDPPSGEVVAYGVLASREGDEAVGGDEPVDLDRTTSADRAGRDGWRSGRVAAVAEQLLQMIEAEPGRNGLRRAPSSSRWMTVVSAHRVMCGRRGWDRARAVACRRRGLPGREQSWSLRPRDRCVRQRQRVVPREASARVAQR
jgi:hypothetical protein